MELAARAPGRPPQQRQGARLSGAPRGTQQRLPLLRSAGRIPPARRAAQLRGAAAHTLRRTGLACRPRRRNHRRRRRPPRPPKISGSTTPSASRCCRPLQPTGSSSRRDTHLRRLCTGRARPACTTEKKRRDSPARCPPAQSTARRSDGNGARMARPCLIMDDAEKWIVLPNFMMGGEKDGDIIFQKKISGTRQGAADATGFDRSERGLHVSV